MKDLVRDRGSQASIVFVICLFFVLFLAFLPERFHGRGYDYWFHFDKARGFAEDRFGRPTVAYSPLFSWITGFFSYSERAFYVVCLLLIGFALPLALFFLSRHWVAVLLYFCVSEFFWFFEQGVFAQALVGFLLVLMFLFEDWRIRFVLLVAGVLAHSVGFFALALAWFFISLKRIDFGKVFGGCSGLFGRGRPDFLLDKKLVVLPQHASPASVAGLRVGFLLKFFFSDFSFSFFVFFA